MCAIGDEVGGRRPARVLRVAGCAFLLAIPLSAQAVPSCKGVSATPISFGTYDPLAAAPLDGAGSITCNCPPPANPVVSLSRGGAPGYTPRQMRQGSEALAYNLYLDAARTVIWGDGTGGTVPLDGPPGNNQVIPVYGRIFPLQDVSAGTYSDTIVVTVNF